MTWMKALKWATPVWIVTIAAIGALMFLTDFAAGVGTAEALKRLVLGAFVALPLITFLVKETIDDLARFRAAFLGKHAGGSDG